MNSQQIIFFKQQIEQNSEQDCSYRHMVTVSMEYEFNI